MKLTLTTNLGLFDSRRLGVPQALEGQTIDCDQIAAESLLKFGWAVAAAPEPAKPLPPNAPAAGLSAPPKPGGGK